MNSVELTGLETFMTIALGLITAVIVLALVIIWRKGRPFAKGDVFRASRLSAGNHLLPTQVLVTPTNVVHFTPQWFGKYEHSIHMAHIASVGIDTHILFSDLLIETSGGTAPVHCKGHLKGDAVEMKALIEKYQTEYYTRAGQAPAPSAAPAAPAR